MGNLLPGEQVQESQDKFEVERVRRVIADTYTFVRSQEYNRTISSYTFDHYIEFAKQRIKGKGREIRNAAGGVLGVRAPKLDALLSLQNSFKSVLTQARVMAEKVDKEES